MSFKLSLGVAIQHCYFNYSSGTPTSSNSAGSVKVKPSRSCSLRVLLDIVVAIMVTELTNRDEFNQVSVVTGSGKYGSNSGQSLNMAAGDPAAHGTSTSTPAPVALILANTLKQSTFRVLITLMGWYEGATTCTVVKFRTLGTWSSVCPCQSPCRKSGTLQGSASSRFLPPPTWSP